MRAITRHARQQPIYGRATGNRMITPANARLPNGVGETITGGPMVPIDLMEILAWGARDVARTGAISGAAHVAVSDIGRTRDRDSDIALSDGSRITFASIGDG